MQDAVSPRPGSAAEDEKDASGVNQQALSEGSIMRNATRYVAIIVIGSIALVAGVLFQVWAFGYYPTRAIMLIVVGVIL